MINAQKYIDTLYGENKERDSKPEHKNYLRIIENLIECRNANKRMYEYKLKENNDRWKSELDLQCGWLEQCRKEIQKIHKDKSFYSNQWELVSKENAELKKKVDTFTIMYWEMVEYNNRLKKQLKDKTKH